MYYESDFRMAGGEIELLYKERSYLFFSDYIARISIQEMSILVSMRVYPKGYGKIMNLVADESRTDAECIKTKKRLALSSQSFLVTESGSYFVITLAISQTLLL